MAPKKKAINAYSVYMVEIQQTLLKQGIKLSMPEMSEYCKKDWENMSDQMKEKYKIQAKNLKSDKKKGKFTSIGENVEDVQKQSDVIIFQANAMYEYIKELLDMQPSNYYLLKQTFIVIHVNPYTCEKEGFYFPAEISMAEFSLEKGLIRIFHQLIGFDQVRTSAPKACTADINNHAANNHKINAFLMFPSVAMASDNLTMDVFSTIVSIGCNYHEKLEHSHVCSNFFVCKWIHIVSAHCCRYFDIKLAPGCHYDFDLSEIENPVEENFDKPNISKFSVNFSINTEIDKSISATNNFPALENKSSNVIQKPKWNKPESKVNTNHEIVTNNINNFPPLGDLKSIQKITPTPYLRIQIKSKNINSKR